ncbi:MAG: 1,4-alpha-glucan branching protein GlgB [Bauldia sp.]
MAGKPRETPQAAVDAIVAGSHGDPFAVLGLHDVGGTRVVRAFVPGAETVHAETRDGMLLGELARRHDGGFFEGPIGRGARIPYRLTAANAGGAWTFEDAYAFGPVLGPMDDYYASEGTHLRLFDKLGAHLLDHEGASGVHFAVWAPNAERVSVVGDFNAWDGRRNGMRKRLDTGVWEIFVPGVGEGTVYKFEIVGPGGVLQPLKSDPYAVRAELRPRTASIVGRTDNFVWHDADYLAERRARDPRRTPMSAYEVHLGSWRRADGNRFLTYDELADQLIPYAADLGFTHLELMPVSEHPLDESWGYQPTGLFAPTARFGDPAGFARLVDRAHQAGLGIILDWVPAHFPTDQHGLSRFDGTYLYEHADPRRGFHPDWNTAIYNFGRREVSAFLVNNALFWLERYHVDGLRVDAVASMLYLDYSRKAGEWLPNIHGGRENLDAVEFLKRLNATVYGTHPGTVTIAEESTAWPGVSQPAYAGGLGFGFKWNMGFMHDTLAYLQRDPIHRSYHHNDLTFGLLYAFTENFVLPLSHDEVVHGKASLLSKMAGDDWQKFASLRAYYAFMWAYPGKKLLFMGQEFGQWREWAADRSLDWHLTEFAPHRGLQSLIRDLNRAYRDNAALYARDCEGEGFQWLIVDDADWSVLGWLRRGAPGDPPVAAIVNFTSVPRHGYQVPLPEGGAWREIVNTDAAIYGGSGTGNFGRVIADAGPHKGMPASAMVTLPPLATIFLRLGEH